MPFVLLAHSFLWSSKSLLTTSLTTTSPLSLHWPVPVFSAFFYSFAIFFIFTVLLVVCPVVARSIVRLCLFISVLPASVPNLNCKFNLRAVTHSYCVARKIYCRLSVLISKHAHKHLSKIYEDICKDIFICVFTSVSALVSLLYCKCV